MIEQSSNTKVFKVNDVEENELVKTIITNNIEALYESYGIPLNKLRAILSNNRCDTNTKCKFNFVTREISRIEDKPIMDIILYFDRYHPVQNIVEFLLDDETKLLLKDEMAEEYNKKNVKVDFEW